MQTSIRSERRRSRWPKEAAFPAARPKKPSHPEIVSRDEWLVKRRWHLVEEKRVTKERDRLIAERRRLPMVRLDKDYFFEGPGGRQSLRDLFAGRRQLIVYHFMFDPRWNRGCPGCTGYMDALGDLSLLARCDTTFVVVSRAPLPKLEACRKRQGWDCQWVSSFGSDFNYDFHVTLDERIAPVEYNYRTKEQLAARHEPGRIDGEAHGLSVFFRLGREVFHTYSAYARGVEGLTNAYSLLDCTPYGRQEDWEDSPRGWPQRPTYGAPAERGEEEERPEERVGGEVSNVIRYSPEWPDSRRSSFGR